MGEGGASEQSAPNPSSTAAQLIESSEYLLAVEMIVSSEHFLAVEMIESSEHFLAVEMIAPLGGFALLVSITAG